jgi:hypothetical protein
MPSGANVMRPGGANYNWWAMTSGVATTTRSQFFIDSALIGDTTHRYRTLELLRPVRR